MTIRMLIAKLKDKFTTKVPTYCYAQASCPWCGAGIQVPLTPVPTELECVLCNTNFATVGIGLVNRDEQGLEDAYRRVSDAVMLANTESSLH